MEVATLKRFFNVNKTAFYWKKTLSKTFMGEVSVWLQRTGWLAFLLGTNAGGDLF